MEPQIYASSKKLLCLGERLIFLYRGPKTKENNILEVDVILNDSILNTSYSIKDYQKNNKLNRQKITFLSFDYFFHLFWD